MTEKGQRANRYGFPSRLGLWLLGTAMVLFAPATVKAAVFDGQYQGTFAGEGSGSITFSVNGGVVSGSVSGSWGGDSISGSFSGSVSADGRMVTTLSGIIKTPPSSEGGKESEPTAFSGRMTGTVVVSGPLGDPSGQVPTAASGTWKASALTTASGSWRASGSTASPPDTENRPGVPGPGTPEKPVAPETTEYTWSDYAKDFEKYSPEEQAEAIARMTPEQRAELDRARAELKKEKTDEDAWDDYAKDFEKLSPEKQTGERKRLTPEQEAKLDRVRTKLKNEQKAETTEYGWDDYAKDFEKLSPEKQAEERAKLTPEQEAKLDQLVKEREPDGQASDVAITPGASADKEKPEDPTKKEAPRPVSEMTRQESLLKTWDWYQSQYRAWENAIENPLNQDLKNMAEIKQRLQDIKKDYEKEFGHPIPGKDYTETQYPPQTPKQQEALRIYQEFKNVSEAHKKAADQEADIINRLRETPILNTRADAESREAATKRKEALEEQLKQIKQEWADKNLHADLGPLKIETIPDPQHQPLDPRKDRRKVDKMEYKIKGGAQLESGRTGNGR